MNKLFGIGRYKKRTFQKYFFDQELHHPTEFDFVNSRFLNSDCNDLKQEKVSKLEIKSVFNRNVHDSQIFCQLFDMCAYEMYLRWNEEKLKTILDFIIKNNEEGAFIFKITSTSLLKKCFKKSFWMFSKYEASKVHDGHLSILVVKHISRFNLKEMEEKLLAMFSGNIPIELTDEAKFSLMIDYDFTIDGTCQEIVECLMNLKESDGSTIPIYAELLYQNDGNQPQFFDSNGLTICRLKYAVETILKKYPRFEYHPGPSVEMDKLLEMIIADSSEITRDRIEINTFLQSLISLKEKIDEFFNNQNNFESYKHSLPKCAMGLENIIDENFLNNYEI